MAIRSPTTAAELITFLTGGANDGDVIELVDTTGFSDNRYNLTAERGSIAPIYVTNSLIVRSANGRGAYFNDPVGDGSPANATEFPWAFTRKTLVKGFLGLNGALGKTLRLENIAMHPGIWPNRALNERWDTLPGSVGNIPGLIYGINRPQCPDLIGVEAFVGEQTTAAAFDVTVKHPAARSPSTWYFDPAGGNRITPTFPNSGNPTYDTPHTGWGDATYEDYSWICNMPTFFRTDGSGSYGTPDWRDLYLHDITGMSYVTGPSSGQLRLEPKYCMVLRNYQDVLQFQQNSNLAGRIIVSGAFGCMVVDSWGNFNDNGNPHVDFLQQAITNANTNNYPNSRSGRNFLIKRPACRGDGTQGSFLTASGSTAGRSGQESPRIHNVVAINQAKAASIAGAMNAAIDGLIAVTSASNPNNSFASGSVLIDRKNSSGNPMADIIASIRRATVESLSGDARRFVDLPTYQKVTKGAAGAALNNFALDLDTSTLHQIFEAYKTVDPAKGVGNVTLRQLVNAPYDYSTMAKFLGVINQSNVAPNTLITSDPLTVTGFNIGDTLLLHVETGLEFQVIDLLSGTVLRAWGTADWNYVDGYHSVQFRQTSAGLDGSVSRMISFGSNNFFWTLYTRSAHQFPTFKLPATTRIARTAAGLTGLPATSDKFSLWLKMKPKSITGVQCLMYLNTGSYVQVINNAGGMNVVFRINTSPTILSVNRSGAFAVDAEIDVKIALDVTLNKYIIYINDLPQSFSSLTDNSDTNGNLQYPSSNIWSMFGTTSNGNFNAVDTEISLFMIAPTQYIDWENDLKRLIAANPDYVGPNLQGLTGIQPKLAIIGDAALIEAGNGNLGDGGAISRTGTSGGSALVSVNANAGNYLFPPNLTLAADIVGSALLTLGQTLAIDVYPRGFAKAGVGFARAVSGVTGTFDSASYTLPTTFDSDKGYGSSPRRVLFTPTQIGNGQINFTPNSGYIAPAPVNFTVVDVPVAPGVGLRNRFGRLLSYEQTLEF